MLVANSFQSFRVITEKALLPKRKKFKRGKKIKGGGKVQGWMHVVY